MLKNMFDFKKEETKCCSKHSFRLGNNLPEKNSFSSYYQIKIKLKSYQNQIKIKSKSNQNQIKIKSKSKSKSNQNQNQTIILKGNYIVYLKDNEKAILFLWIFLFLMFYNFFLKNFKSQGRNCRTKLEFNVSLV